MSHNRVRARAGRHHALASVLALALGALVFWTTAAAGASTYANDNDQCVAHRRRRCPVPRRRRLGRVRRRLVHRRACDRCQPGRPPGPPRGTRCHHRRADRRLRAPAQRLGPCAGACRATRDTLYVGGTFSTVNGVARRGIVALDPTTGATLPGFIARANHDVLDLALDGDDLYLSGRFWNVNDINREKVARVDATTGVLDPIWAPRSDDGTVTAVAVDPILDRVYVGGFFSGIDGVANSGHLAAIDRSHRRCRRRLRPESRRRDLRHRRPTGASLRRRRWTRRPRRDPRHRHRRPDRSRTSVTATSRCSPRPATTSSPAATTRRGSASARRCLPSPGSAASTTRVDTDLRAVADHPDRDRGLGAARDRHPALGRRCDHGGLARRRGGCGPLPDRRSRPGRHHRTGRATGSGHHEHQ